MIHETTYTQARERLAALMDQVTDTREPVLIRRRGHEPVALVPADELAGWLETVHLLRSPKNAKARKHREHRHDALCHRLLGGRCGAIAAEERAASPRGESARRGRRGRGLRR